MNTGHESPSPVTALPTVLGVDELTHALQVGEDKVRALVASGELRRLSYAKGKILVSRREVFEFLQRSTNGVG